MKLSSNPYDLTFLKSEFEEIKFELLSTADSQLLNCIVCWCETANDVITNWQAIQNLISAYFQPVGQFAQWNVYLVIFCAEELPVRVKYIIQNDKYSVRKIVLDGLDVLPDSDEAVTVVNKELLGSDLSLGRIESVVLQNINPAISDLISGAPSDMSVESKNKRASMIKNIIRFLKKDEN
jgi:hypothetical protein